MFDFAPAPDAIWISLSAVFVIQFIVFVVGTIIKDYSIADICEGFIIAIPNAIILAVNGNIHARTIIILVMIWVWALRIAVWRSVIHRGEDWKYRECRKVLDKIGGYQMVIFGCFGIFVYQGCVLFIIGSVPNLNQLYSDEEYDLFIATYLGIIVYALGLVLSTFADIQLYNFRRKAKNKGHVYKNGVWQYCRHPNYVGECLVWWGMYLVVCDNDLGYIPIWSPLTITIVLRFF